MLVGLTGNFGSGKSTVLELFRKAGAAVVDSDSLVKNLYNHKHIQDSVVRLLGNVLDPKGNIDKKKIAKIVFVDERMKERLEKLLHPHVIRMIKEFAQQHSDRVVVAEIPLLFEAGYADIVDKTVLTVCPLPLLEKRLIDKGFSPEDIAQRLSNQIPDEEKRNRVDFVINTDKGIEDLRDDVFSILKTIVASE